jgi:hypothetical protein
MLKGYRYWKVADHFPVLLRPFFCFAIAFLKRKCCFFKYLKQKAQFRVLQTNRKRRLPFIPFCMNYLLRGTDIACG